MTKDSIKISIDPKNIGKIKVKMLHCGQYGSLWRGWVNRMYRLRLVNEGDETKVISSRLDRSFLGRVSRINTEIADLGEMVSKLNVFTKSNTEICGVDAGFSIDTFLGPVPEKHDDIHIKKLIFDVEYSYEVTLKNDDLSRLFGVAITLIYSNVKELSLGG